MKQFLILVLFLNTFIAISQNTISTPYFSFSCDCNEVESQYSKTNKSFNYSYQTNDGNSIYMISVKPNVTNKSGFLNAIKNSGTFEYKDSTFKGFKAIKANMKMNGQFGIHIGFFKSDTGYSIIIASKYLPQAYKLYDGLERKIVLK